MAAVRDGGGRSDQRRESNAAEPHVVDVSLVLLDVCVDAESETAVQRC